MPPHLVADNSVAAHRHAIKDTLLAVNRDDNGAHPYDIKGTISNPAAMTTLTPMMVTTSGRGRH